MRLSSLNYVVSITIIRNHHMLLPHWLGPCQIHMEIIPWWQCHLVTHNSSIYCVFYHLLIHILVCLSSLAKSTLPNTTPSLFHKVKPYGSIMTCANLCWMHNFHISATSWHIEHVPIFQHINKLNTLCWLITLCMRGSKNGHKKYMCQKDIGICTKYVNYFKFNV